MKASYAYGPLLYHTHSYDTDQGASTSATDLEMTSMAFLTLYQMNFHLLTVQKHLTQVILHVDAEFTGFTVAYTAGGMTTYR